jgi:hypothetical protein
VKVAAIALQLLGVGHICPGIQFVMATSAVVFGPFVFAFLLGACATAGVGMSQDPDPVSPVVGTDGASWNKKYLLLISFAFQVSQHTVEPHIDVPSNIFCNDPSGPDLLDKSEKFRPEVTVICLAFSLPGNAKWLAGIAPANKSNVPDPVFFKLFSCECSNVIVLRHVGPVLV